MTTDGPECVNLDPKFIACHYAKTWFALDFLSTLPFDYVCVFVDDLFEGINFTGPDGFSAIRLLHLAKLLGLLKLLRLSRLCRYVSVWQENSVSQSNAEWLG